MSARKVDRALAWRVARNTLGRMACEYADPNRDGHDHKGVCLRDDEAYVADLMLALIAAGVAGDESKVLDRLTDLIDALPAGE